MQAAERGFIDDIVRPQDTREIISKCLNAIMDKEIPKVNKKHSNLPL